MMTVAQEMKMLLQKGVTFTVRKGVLIYAVPEKVDSVPIIPVVRAYARSIINLIGDNRTWAIANFNQENWLAMCQRAIGRQETGSMIYMVYGNGRIDTSLLQSCVDTIVQRHESLRTTFVFVNEQFVQVIHQTFPTSFDSVECRLPLQGLIQALREKVKEQLEVTFNPIKGPPFRMMVMNGKDSWGIMLNMDHLAFDDASTLIFFYELSALYNGMISSENVALPPVAVQYADHCMRYRSMLSSNFLDHNRRYWEEKVDALKKPKRDPDPHSDSDKEIVLYGETEKRVLPIDLVALLKEYTLYSQLSLFTIFFTVYALAVQSYFSDRTCSIGIQFNNRDSDLTTVGYFTEVLPISIVMPKGQDFMELARLQKEYVKEAYNHIPFPVANQLGLPTNFFYNFSQAPGERILFEGCRVTGDELLLPSFDLFHLAVRVQGNHIELIIHSDPKRVGRKTVGKMLDSCEQMLRKYCIPKSVVVQQEELVSVSLT